MNEAPRQKQEARLATLGVIFSSIYGGRLNAPLSNCTARHLSNSGNIRQSLRAEFW